MPGVKDVAPRSRRRCPADAARGLACQTSSPSSARAPPCARWPARRPACPGDAIARAGRAHPACADRANPGASTRCIDPGARFHLARSGPPLHAASSLVYGVGAAVMPALVATSPSGGAAAAHEAIAAEARRAPVGAPIEQTGARRRAIQACHAMAQAEKLTQTHQAKSRRAHVVKYVPLR